LVGRVGGEPPAIPIIGAVVQLFDDDELHGRFLCGWVTALMY